MKTLLIKTADKIININLEQNFLIHFNHVKDSYFIILDLLPSLKNSYIYIEDGLTIKEAKIILNLIQNAIIHEKTFIDLSNLEID